MREFFSKLSRYTITAGIAAVVDVGGFALLIWMKLPVAPAGVASFCVATFVNYRLTSRFVFGHSATVQGYVLFFIASLTGLAVNVGITLLGVYILDLPPIIAKVLGVGVAFLVNFMLNLRIVFRSKEAAVSDQLQNR